MYLNKYIGVIQIVNLTCFFIILSCIAFLFPYIVTLANWIVNKIEHEEEVEQEEVIVMNDNLDSLEVEMPIIQHNNNKLLFPLDDMPQGIFLFNDMEEDEKEDSGIYDDREVSN